MYLGSYVCKTSDVYPLSFFHVETLDIDKTANCRVVVDHAVNSVFVRIGFFRLDSWWWGGTAVLVFFSCTGYIACQLLLWWTCWNAVFKDLYRMVGHTWRKTEMVHDVNCFPINWNKCYRTTRCEVKLLREYSTLTVVGFELWCAEKLLWCGFWWTCGLVKSLWSLPNMTLLEI